ncbi:MAG: sigma-70 family RNA polymerase sigma factor [Leptolinea sp.]
MNNQNELDLLLGAKEFNLNSLGIIYEQYSIGLYRYALRLLGDEALAQDCVSETFSRFLKALRDEKGPRDYLRAYLYRTAHNWITDIYRRQPPPALELDEAMHDGEQSKPETCFDDKMEREQVRAAMWRLPPDQRQVVTLKYVEGWENDEITEAMQKPAGTVRVLQHRALDAMRRMLLRDDKEGVYGFE